MASEIKVDTISEKTSAGGVTIDGLLIKDGGISGDVSLIGTTPTFTIGDAGAEDAALVFDGNAQDFYIALDDSADDLLIGLGSTVGTTPAIAIDENLKVNIPVTTASTSASTGSLTTGGGAGIGADLYVGDDVYLITDSAVLGFGADKDTLLTHTDGTGLTLNSTNKLCFNDASQFVQGSSNAILSLGATDEIDLTATAVDLNGTLDVSGTSQFNAAVTLAGTTPTLTIGDAGTEDAKIVFDGNAQDWHIGLDDSADDLVIGLGSTLGTTSHIVIDETGAVTKPLQPAFLLEDDSDTELAHNTEQTLSFDSELFDQNADVTATTFTAPVTGRYFFTASCLIDVGSAAEHIKDNYIRFLASNRSAFMGYGSIYSSTNNRVQLKGAVLMDMDANDTIYTQAWFNRNSGTGVGTIAGSNPHLITHFSGHLVC